MWRLGNDGYFLAKPRTFAQSMVLLNCIGFCKIVYSFAALSANAVEIGRYIIVESNRIVREVTVARCSGGMYLIKFAEGGGIQVREHRLFATQEEAEAGRLGKKEEPKKYRSPYDYEH